MAIYESLTLVPLVVPLVVVDFRNAFLIIQFHENKRSLRVHDKLNYSSTEFRKIKTKETMINYSSTEFSK